MAHARRVDQNHAAIVQALRRCGWYVHDTSRLGGGFPDLVAAKGGRLELIEVKDGDKPLSAQVLTAPELAFRLAMQTAGISVRIISSVEQAVAL